MDIDNIDNIDLNNILYNDYIKLDFFFNNYKCNKFNNYNYIEVTDEELYYVTCMNIGLFVNRKKQIIMHSYQLFMNIEHIKPQLKNILQCLNNIDLETNILEINKNIICVQKFNDLYGHYKDEIFCLNDFYDNFLNTNSTYSQYYPLIDFKENSFTQNYSDIANLLFDDKWINPNKFNNIIKIKNLIIVEHHYNLDTFHLFPFYSKNKILNRISNCNNDNINIFLTRKKCPHINRNIDNIEDINIFLSNNNFIIINPENISYVELIKYIRQAKKIVVTWGSALVNLIYADNHTNIYVLKSNSYKNEGVGIFRNLIKNYKLNIRVIECDNNNNIPVEELQL